MTTTTLYFEKRPDGYHNYDHGTHAHIYRDGSEWRLDYVHAGEKHMTFSVLHGTLDAAKQDASAITMKNATGRPRETPNAGAFSELS